jgi:DNA-binding NarL/FixJ family response regulator
MNRLYDFSTYSNRLRVVSIGRIRRIPALTPGACYPEAGTRTYCIRTGTLKRPKPVHFRTALRLDFGIMTMGDRQLILVYSDEGVLAAGAATLLLSAGRFDVVLAKPELSSLIPQVERISPDLILLGLTSEMTLGFFSALRESLPTAPIIFWDRQFSDELVEQARELGAVWFLQRGHSADAFLSGVLKIASGAEPIPQSAPAHSTRVSLTPREAQLVTLLVQGLRNKEIGACLGITEGTVRIYLTKLFVKVGARDRFELAVFGLKNMNCGHAFWDGHNAFVTDVDEDRARPVLRSLLLVEPKRRKGYSQLAKASGE